MQFYTFQGLLQQCLHQLAASGPSPSRLGVAASCSLRLESPARGLKYASKALFLQQDEVNRQLVRECTKEIEHQGRSQAVQAMLAAGGLAGASKAVAKLLTQLQQQQCDAGSAADEQAVLLLRELAAELDAGGADAQIAFDLLGGYDVVSERLTDAACRDAAADALLSAGLCHLYRKHPPPSQQQQQQQQHALSASSMLRAVCEALQSGAPCKERLRIRWPSALLERLMSLALGDHDGSAWDPIGDCALRLLAIAALDPHQRQAGLVDAAGRPVHRGGCGSSGSHADSAFSSVGGGGDGSVDVSSSTGEFVAAAPLAPSSSSVGCDAVSDIVTEMVDHVEVSAGSIGGLTADEQRHVGTMAQYHPHPHHEERLFSDAADPGTPCSLDCGERGADSFGAAVCSEALSASSFSMPASGGGGGGGGGGAGVGGWPGPCSSGGGAAAFASCADAADASYTSRPQLLEALLQAVWAPSWLDRLPAASMLLLAQLLGSFCLGSRFDRQLYCRSAGGRALPTLLRLYKAIQHSLAAPATDTTDGASSSASSPAASAASSTPAVGKPPCCAACHLLLSSLLSLARQEPSVVRAEAFIARPVPAPGQQQAPPPGESPHPSPSPSSSPYSSRSTSSSGGQLLLTPTPLLGELVQSTRHALSHCRPCSLPDLEWDGSVKKLEARASAPADPCSQHTGELEGTNGGGGSLLEMWVLLLGAVAGSGKAPARELHRRRVLDLLQEVLDACHSSPPSLLQAVEAAYGACARQSQAMAQAIFDSSSVPALVGMALHSRQPSLVLVALDRLTPLIDKCSGSDYLNVVARGPAAPAGGGGSGGVSGGGGGNSVLAAAHHLMLLSLAASASKGASNNASNNDVAAAAAPSGGSGGGARPAAAGTTAAAAAVHPWDAALRAASDASAAAAGALLPSKFLVCGAAALAPPPPPDFGLPQAGALKDAAQCLLLACLDRSRRQAGLKSMQTPRHGYFASVRPRELLMLERRLREAWATALLPQLPSQAASSQCGKDAEGTPAPTAWQPRPAAWQPRPTVAAGPAGKLRAVSAPATEPGGSSVVAPSAAAPAAPSCEGQGGAAASTVACSPEQAPAAHVAVQPLHPQSLAQPQQPGETADTPAVADAPLPADQAMVPQLRSRRSESLEDTARGQGYRSQPLKTVSSLQGEMKQRPASCCLELAEACV